jgi:hypothetical protein
MTEPAGEGQRVNGIAAGKSFGRDCGFQAVKLGEGVQYLFTAIVGVPDEAPDGN